MFDSMHPEELQRLQNAMQVTLEALRRFSPQAGYGQSSQQWYGGGSGGSEQLPEMIRERVEVALKERLVDELRERAGEVSASACARRCATA